jgi:hypothetical protein
MNMASTINDRPRHPLNGQFLAHPHTVGRALMAQHRKQAQAAPAKAGATAPAKLRAALKK